MSVKKFTMFVSQDVGSSQRKLINVEETCEESDGYHYSFPGGGIKF